jgi:hypothetical protein
MRAVIDMTIKNFYSIIMVSVLVFILMGCSKVDDIREPISCSGIDWKYLATDGNVIRVESIRVYANDKRLFVKPEKLMDFLSLLNENSGKIYNENSSNTLKIYLKFSEQGSLSFLYQADKYDGKECTFYISKELEKTLVTFTEDIQLE